ncbi:hypothetical protein PAECIP111892_01790 [Paenibacillus auburnensis]|uniref:Uncharacterized protein n=1 Tax=Paenibacillus auburnensis TaxID=2905649 RepID=A0ABN8G409_9BACL|nr:hypothetical protein PAECIP111892_01790 [Paenibacillus auburnensis]
MPNLITIASATIEVPSYPSRTTAAGRIASRNRRAAIKKMLWPFAKSFVVLLGLFVKEVFL